MKSEKEYWEKTKSLLGNESLTLGPYNSYQLRNTPRRFLITLAYYKFAAKMLQRKSNILELGCSEGLGASIAGEFADNYTGIDLDENAIQWAKQNFEGDRCKFILDNFNGKAYGKFDGLLSLDVIEHILPDNDCLFWETVCQNLTDDGVAVIGTPNKPSQVYASEVTKSGHINLYDHEKFWNCGEKYFSNVFLFSANDETIHTGFYPMAHYLIAVCVSPKR